MPNLARVPAAGAGVAALAAALSGCGAGTPSGGGRAGDTPSMTQSTMPSQSPSQQSRPPSEQDPSDQDLSHAQPPPSPGTPSSDDPSPTSDQSSSGDPSGHGARAIRTAEHAVGGGRAFDVELADDDGRRGWDVGVAGRGGRQHELRISADGTRVIQRRQDDDSDDGSQDVRRATVPALRAIETARSRARGQGPFTSLDLDDDKRIAWEVEFGGDDGVTVDVNARRGTVIGVDRDSDRDDDSDADNDNDNEGDRDGDHD